MGLSRSRLRLQLRFFEAAGTLPGHVVCSFPDDSLPVQRERTLENHFYRSSGWIVDLISASEEHLGKASGSPNTAANESAFAAASEGADDRALRSWAGDRPRIFAFGAVGLNAAFFVD